MNKNKMFAVLFSMFCLVVMIVPVLADQEGNNRWCNIDQYGCWITDVETGEQNYIMFWSEESRQYFMGDASEPYKNVIDRCVDCESGKLPLDPANENRRGIGRVTYRTDGLEFDTAEKFLSYVAERDGYDSCVFVSDCETVCK